MDLIYLIMLLGKFRTVRTMPNSEIKKEFELGKAFDDKTPGGKDCKATITAVRTYLSD